MLDDVGQSKRAQDRQELDRQVFDRLMGVVLFPIALFPLLAMVTYNWRDISWLQAPPLSPPSNLIGMAGAWSVFFGYSIFGLAFWMVPFFVLVFSSILLFGNGTRILRRLFWTSLFLVALCCLVQLGSDTVFSGVLERLNLRPNAGGAIGYVLMTCLLAHWFSPVGGGILMLSIMIISLTMIIGIRNLFVGLGLLTGWWSVRQERHAKERAAAEAAAAVAAAERAKERAAATERAKERLAAVHEAAEKERAEERKPEEPPVAEPILKPAKLVRTETPLERAKRLREAARRAREEASRIRAEERQALERRTGAVPPPAKETVTVEPEPASEPVPARAESRPAVEQPKPEAPVPVAAKPVARTETKVAEKHEKPAVAKPAAVPAAAGAVEIPTADTYQLPPVSLLNPLPTEQADHGDVNAIAAILVETLANYNIPVEVIGHTSGPIITRYELRPDPHVKVERITALQSNLQMALEAVNIRIEAPIPGKNAVGIEIPNRTKCPVTFRELMESETWRKAKAKMEIPLALGKDVAGNDLIVDLTKMPHLLVAGSTGSGKSVCLNSILAGFLMSRAPEDLRLILIDPKRVEFVTYNDLPHLLVPVINDSNRVAFGLRWAIIEMDRRYKLMQKVGCRNIVAFNHRPKVTQGEFFDTGAAPAADDSIPEKLPYIVIVADEVADIMASVGKQVEPMIARLASLSRAVGIHLILATQRPSVDVITGTIKSNIPGRIAFKVTQGNDSRTILDNPGAEELIGKGDMLFLRDGSQLMRAQGAWVADDEINRVVGFVKERCQPCYDPVLSGKLEKIQEADAAQQLDEASEASAPEPETGAAPADGGAADNSTAASDDALIPQVYKVIRTMRRASTSLLQRKLNVGYVKASRLMDILEERGIIGPPSSTGARELLVDPDTLVTDDADPAVPADGDSGAGEPAADGDSAEDAGAKKDDSDPVG